MRIKKVLTYNIKIYYNEALGNNSITKEIINTVPSIIREKLESRLPNIDKVSIRKQRK